MCNASSVSDYTDEHGLGWFDLDLLIEVEKTFRSLGLTKQHIDMSTLFTNDMVRHL